MTSSNDPRNSDDPYDLTRFVRAQGTAYEQALSEIRNGRKRTHWMWYIFPQLDGLGVSTTSNYYAIKSLPEAKAYLAHPLLGPRLRECMEAVLQIENRSAREIFGTPDDLKLRSCATLFACISPTDSVFGRVLQKYYAAGPDCTTLQLVHTRP